MQPLIGLQDDIWVHEQTNKGVYRALKDRARLELDQHVRVELTLVLGSTAIKWRSTLMFQPAEK